MSRLRLPLVILLAVVAQTALVDRIRVAGVAPDAMLLLAVGAAIVGGPERGAIAGFGAGIAIDLFLQTTPLGLSALVFSVVGYGVGVITGGIVRAAWWIPILTAAAACAAGEVLFAVAAAVMGHAQLMRPHLATVAALVGLFDGILAPLALRLAAWADRTQTEGTVPARLA